MDEKVKATILKTIHQILEDSTSKKNLRMLLNKHKGKVHFIPIRYRILGGILQGLNIKFGIFIEQLLENLVEIDPCINAMPYSGKKIKLFFTHTTDALIDTYITNR